MSSKRAQAPRNLKVTASVVAIVGGERPFAVTYPSKRSVGGKLREHTSITFSLSSWRGKDRPQCGQMVVLEDILLFKRGWRARVAYPISLSNTQQ
ncbi:MAG TPA: hypothetical protein VEB18_01255 [Candidatus Paceibacterota bacterium]|nr:hypothetical protein [Candidatus Paceibacterota bacterium]